MGDESKQSKGGKARAKSLSAKKRSAIAAEGGKARWMPKAIEEGVLKLGDISIPCYVLENGTRVLSARGFEGAFSATSRGKRITQEDGAAALPSFLASEEIKSSIPADLIVPLGAPIEFQPLRGGRSALGYEATILPATCKALLAARRNSKLKTHQLRIADAAEMLVSALADVGIIALVDEATGYQEQRPKNALQAYLETIIRKELAAWAKRFPDEFYENIYKLHGWSWPGMGKNRYSVVAHYTNDLVYERIAPTLKEELAAKSPKNENGQRKNKLHQWLTEDVGHPMLSQHMHAITMLQRLAIKQRLGWKRFVRMVDQVLPKKGTTLELALPEPGLG